MDTEIRCTTTGLVRTCCPCACHNEGTDGGDWHVDGETCASWFARQQAMDSARVDAYRASGIPADAPRSRRDGRLQPAVLHAASTVLDQSPPERRRPRDILRRLG